MSGGGPPGGPTGEPLLPQGIRIGACVDEAENWAVRVDLRARPGDYRVAHETAEITAALVLPPRQARALAALLLRQADLIESRREYPAIGPGLRLVPR